MNVATLSSRLNSPEIYAYADISSPGITITEDIPEPTGTRSVCGAELPPWQQDSIARHREQSINRLPVALLAARTGTHPPVLFAAFILVQERIHVLRPETTISIPRLIAQIRLSLSLQIKQLAEVLAVERPTVYAWIKEQSEPRPQKRIRLRQLYQLAKRWDELADEPLGKALTDVASDGHSILELLRQSEIPQSLIVDRFKGIVGAKGLGGTAARQRRKTLSQIAEEHGIETARVKQQNDQIDTLTGKRVALD